MKVKPLKVKLLFLYFVLFNLIVSLVSSVNDYSFEDEPVCRDDCLGLTSSEKNECLKTYIKFYSYKLVKNMVNFAKLSVYAGIWAIRYEKADLELYEKVFIRLVNQYNDPKVLGNVDFKEFNQTTRFIFEAFRPYTAKRDKSASVRYEFYPSLKCSVPCIYELHTWQTLFYLSVIIFALALVTVILYSISLRSQYASFKERLGNFKSQATSDT